MKSLSKEPFLVFSSLIEQSVAYVNTHLISQNGDPGQFSRPYKIISQHNCRQMQMDLSQNQLKVDRFTWNEIHL